MVVVSSWPVETARLKRIPLSACNSAEKAEPEWEIQATFPGSRSARSSNARARNPSSTSANPMQLAPQTAIPASAAMLLSRSVKGGSSGGSSSPLAPTIATERASSMARRASFTATVLSAVAHVQALLQALPTPVAPDLPHAVVRRDGAHSATGVGGRRGLVEAPDGGPVIRVTGSRPHVEELLGRQLGVAVDHPVRVSLELFPMGLLGPFVRDPLRKERHYVVPLGAERAVEHRGYDAVRKRPARRLSAARILEGLLDVVDGMGQLYGPAEGLPSTGIRTEVGE